MNTKTKKIVLDQIKNCKTPRWSVILLNDNTTTMDFVVKILIDVFKKNTEEAVNTMLKIHNEGEALVGIYSYEVARAKVSLTHQLAQHNKYPLRATMKEY